jgi:hypothetical protein
VKESAGVDSALAKDGAGVGIQQKRLSRPKVISTGSAASECQVMLEGETDCKDRALLSRASTPGAWAAVRSGSFVRPNE